MSLQSSKTSTSSWTLKLPLHDKCFEVHNCSIQLWPWLFLPSHFVAAVGTEMSGWDTATLSAKLCEFESQAFRLNHEEGNRFGPSLVVLCSTSPPPHSLTHTLQKRKWRL